MSFLVVSLTLHWNYTCDREWPVNIILFHLGDKPKVKSDEDVADSGTETAPSNETAEESDEEPIYYDKNKSFFDNITCETTNPRG